MKRNLGKVLSMLLTVALTLGCVGTAFAAHLDLDDPRNNTGGVIDQGGGNYEVSDPNNTITGSDPSASVTFTDPNASVEVQGNVVVGGIDADGNLTITGGTGDVLTSTGSTGAGIQTTGDLTIDGGVTVNANGTDNYGNAYGVIVGDDLNVNNGSTLNAVGGAQSGGGSYDGLSVTGKIYVDGELYTGNTGGNSVSVTGTQNNNTNDDTSNNEENSGDVVLDTVTLTLYGSDGNVIEPDADGSYSFKLGDKFTVQVEPAEAQGGVFTYDSGYLSLNIGVFECVGGSTSGSKLGYTAPADSGYAAPSEITIHIASESTEGTTNSALRLDNKTYNVTTADKGFVPKTADKGSVPKTADKESVLKIADKEIVPYTADKDSVLKVADEKNNAIILNLSGSIAAIRGGVPEEAPATELQTPGSIVWKPELRQLRIPFSGKLLVLDVDTSMSPEEYLEWLAANIDAGNSIFTVVNNDAAESSDNGEIPLVLSDTYYIEMIHEERRVDTPDLNLWIYGIGVAWRTSDGTADTDAGSGNDTLFVPFQVTGFEKANGKWYYFSQDGTIKSGWARVSDAWYYLEADGAVREGWFQDGDNWYYLKPGRGEMVMDSEYRIGGRISKFSATGRWLGYV